MKKVEDRNKAENIYEELRGSRHDEQFLILQNLPDDQLQKQLMYAVQDTEQAHRYIQEAEYRRATITTILRSRGKYGRVRKLSDGSFTTELDPEKQIQL